MLFSMGIFAQSDELTGTVNVSRLNVRAEPTTDSDILTQINFGEVYRVLGFNEAGDWIRIQYEAPSSAIGWVFGRYLTLNDDILPPSITPEPATDTAFVPPERTVIEIELDVNLRSGPGTQFRILEGIRAGTEVFIIGRNTRGTWVQIQRPIGTGWIAAGVLPDDYVTDGLPVPPDVAVLQGLFWEVPNTVNAHYGPWSFSPIIGTVIGGTSVQVLARNEDASWVKILLDFEAVWIPVAALRPTFPVEQLPLNIS